MRRKRRGNEGNMEFDKKKIRQIAVLIVFTMVVYTAFTNYDKVFATIAFVLDLISPFVLGACIAFILNLPMRGIEKFLKKLTGRCGKGKAGKVLNKLIRPVSLILSICFVVMIVAIVIGVVTPQLIRTIEAIGANLMEQFPKIQAWVQSVFADNPDVEKYLGQVAINWESIFESVKNFVFNGATNLLSHTYSATLGIISAVTSFFIAVVFACYILMQKEKLSGQIQRVLKVTFSEKNVRRINEVASLSHKTFCSFITGQCLEACILGALFFVSMIIFRIPYALLISVLIAFTALIPIVGAFIGCFVGAFLILMINPLQAVFFVIMFLVIQQIEGNLIYPHVVGSSIGLPSIWVLMAVSIGGSLMGILGMLLFIPIVSILYSLFKTWVKNREAKAE